MATHGYPRRSRVRVPDMSVPLQKGESKRASVVIMPVEIARDGNLSPTDYRVLSVILSHDWEKGNGCTASYATLAREAGVGESTVKRAIGKLHADNYLQAPEPMYRNGERIGTILRVTGRVRSDRKMAAGAPAVQPQQLTFPEAGSTVNPPQEQKKARSFQTRVRPDVVRQPLDATDEARLEQLAQWGCTDPRDWLGMLLGLLAERERELGREPRPGRLRAIYDGAVRSRDLHRKEVNNRVGYLLRGIERRFLLARPLDFSYEDLPQGSRDSLEICVDRAAQGKTVSDQTLSDYGIDRKAFNAMVDEKKKETVEEAPAVAIPCEPTGDASVDSLRERLLGHLNPLVQVSVRNSLIRIEAQHVSFVAKNAVERDMIELYAVPELRQMGYTARAVVNTSTPQ